MTTRDAVTELYVHESGTPGAPAIVFLHADGASGGMWDRHMRRLAGYHCLAPDLPGHGRSNQLPWTSLDDTTQQVVGLIEERIPARQAHVVGLSLGGVVAHTLLAHRPELLDRVVIDGAGVLPARGVGLWKLGMALIAPLVHRKLVISVLYRALGGDPDDPAGRAAFAVDLRRSRLPPSGGPSRTPTTTTGSPRQSSAPHVRPCWWQGSGSPGPSGPRTPRSPP